MKILSLISLQLMRYSIVVLLFWYAIVKLANLDDGLVKTVITDSPFLKYAYKIFSANATAKIIGSIEIITAIFIALQPFTNKIGKIGAILGMLIFGNTLLYLFSTPKIWEIQQGILLPVSMGSFIFKDLICFAFCLFSITEKNTGSKKKTFATTKK